MSKKHLIIDAQILAGKRNGLCLSNEYSGAHDKLSWQCDKGHKWEAPFHSIRKGSWCPYCAGRHRTIKDMKEIASKKGGECLSDIYVNSQTKLLWECSKGHKWLTAPREILRGRWCPNCGNINTGLSQKYTIKEMQVFASTKGWKCLSDTYFDSQKKLKWQCDQGHIWESVPANIYRGSGCPKCAGRNVTIEELRKFAHKKNGKCLSPEYEGSYKQLLWECELGHRWSATPRSVLRKKGGTWCPICSSYLSERISRVYFEKIFGFPFPKAKPIWLINKDGHRMEYDGFCKELKIAFEYNGPQHYMEIKKFTPSRDALEKRRRDDAVKKQLSQNHGVKLIVINYLDNLDVLPEIIKKKSVKLGIDVSMFNFDVVIDRDSLHSPKKLIDAKQIALSRGGECLSQYCSSAKEKLMWQCKEGHKWVAPFTTVMHGTWCPFCAKIFPHSYEFVKNTIEQELGYKLISDKYLNTNTKLDVLHTFCGNIYKIRFAGWQSGYRCPKCAAKDRGKKRKLSYDFVKEAIESENGYKLLSDNYVNANAKLNIIHLPCNTIYEVNYGKWQSGRRCPTCAMKKRIYNLNGYKKNAF